MALTGKEFFLDTIAPKLAESGEKAKAINSVYEFKLTGAEESTWTLDLTQSGGKVTEGSTGQAKCTVTIAVNDLSDIIEKKLNPQMAFMSGKLKVQGDMGLAL